MKSPYESPKSLQVEDIQEPLVTLFIAQNQVEALAIRAYLEANEVDCVMVPMGVGNALAMGSVPDTAFQIKVPQTSVEAAQSLLETYSDSEVTDSAEFEAEEPEVEHQVQLKELKRRIKNAWWFLVIPLFPFSPFISLANSMEAIRLSKKLGQSSKWLLLAMILGMMELGLMALFIGAFLGF